MTPSLAAAIQTLTGKVSMAAVATTSSMPKAAEMSYVAIQVMTPSSVVMATTPSKVALAPTP